MGLIEQAAQRLEELRRAGVELPAAAPEAPAARPAAEAPAPRPPVHLAEAGAAREPQGAPLAIDLARLEKSGFAIPGDATSRIANEYRVIKRPLLANAKGANGLAPLAHGTLIMVTSAVPGEGKSFSSVNLAMSIAMEVDRSVLLVDADVARPALPAMLGVPEGPGLLDVLGPRALPLQAAIHPTNVPRLSFMSSGTPHAHAAEALSSEAMIRLLQELVRRAPDRIVVFDSPPLLPTTEARVLARHMGQVVFVVNAGATSHGEVTRALATIEDCPHKFMVLNRVSAPAGHGYGYGYGYGYGRGADGSDKA